MSRLRIQGIELQETSAGIPQNEKDVQNVPHGTRSFGGFVLATGRGGILVLT